MKISFLLSFLFMHVILTAQTIIDFESFDIPQDSFLNGSMNPGGFIENGVILPNQYTPVYGGVWSGWSLSSKEDTLSAGFTNQYSCIAGHGVNGSKQYALTYAPMGSVIKLEEPASDKRFIGMFVNNGTYPYYSMLNGDGFAKKFGGADGNDPDYFALSIKAFEGGELSSDSILFYLADYRFDDNNLDYIVKEWQFINLESFSRSDSLFLEFYSSDSGSFGVNTPTYVFVDNIMIDEVLSSKEIGIPSDMLIYPNPSNGNFNISNVDQFHSIEIINENGRKVHSLTPMGQNTITFLNMNLPDGIYFVRFHSKTGSAIQKLVIVENH